MKKNIYFFVLTMFIAGSFAQIFGQTFECRVSENDYGYLVYEMRETSGTNTPTTSTDINDITFVIRYPSGAVDMDLICTSNDYNIFDGLAAEQTSGDGNYDYHYWNASAVPAVNPPHDWTVNQWEEIAVFKVTGTTGSGLFEVAPNNWEGRSLNWNQTVGGTANDFLPTISGSGITYTYPTLVYDFVWVGGGTGPGADPSNWNQTNNWSNECGAATSSGFWPYQSTENVYIPDVSSGSNSYPTKFNSSSGYAYKCGNLLIGSGAYITVPDLSGNTGTSTYFDITGNCIINGTLNLPPLGHTTVTGSTTINSAEGIEVQADATGVGSFINDGAISYGTSGSGKVQTYITNGAVATNFYMHLMGSTLDEENYTGSGTGADLSAFNVAPGNTYAYSFDEPTNSWVNQFSNTYPVYTSAGIGLSTDDATPYTMNMTGAFIYGNVTTAVLTHGGSGYNLISNPYPSAVDFDVFASDNSDIISNKYWMWDAGSGNYITRASGSGSQQYIQVGQAFFVQAVPSGGTVTFDNSYRTHSNDAFRDVVPNMLTMKVSGGDHGFSDRLTIRFDENATSGYDEEIESVKWNSMYADATMIRSIAEDGTELAINVLPLEGLQGDMVSVPVHFNCGYTADYTFDFEGIDSFEAGNEVWLEDKKNNDHWFYLNDNPHYAFTATSYGDPDRFVIHFFGPTSINEKDEAKVDIYSEGQYAYIKNVTNENIKKVSIYNIAGSLVTSRTIPDGQKLSKIWVSDHMAYYVVQVITDSKVYTNKILITK